MSECAVLENLSEDGFHSCEGFADWSSYSPVHWNGNQEDSSNSFGDWSTFNSNLSKVEKSNKLRSSSVFYDCFHAEETIKDTAVMEIPPLSQMLLNSASTPPQPAALSAAANLCQRLLCEPDCLSLSGPKPRLHSYKQLINTLHLTNSDPNIFQDQDFEEQESSPAALIQTK
uniref:Si:dkey-229e3.2 n=1 Tax=Astyanax mexicanus TaxID=7994 RepID=A0A3B1JZE8_ASTMX